MAEFDEAIQLSPRNAQAHCNRGAVLQNENRLTAAQAEYEAALEIEPKMIVARFNLGAVLARQGDDAAAIRHYEEVLTAAPNHKETLFNLANALCRLDRVAEARVNYARLLKLDPANTRARVAEARTFLIEENAPQAIARLEEAHDLHADDLLIRHELARLLVTSSDAPKPAAQRGLKLALEVMQQQSLLAHVETVAMAYASVGEFEKAIHLQQQAIAAARNAGRADLAEHLNTNLVGFQNNEPCRTAWRTEELLPQATRIRVARRTSE